MIFDILRKIIPLSIKQKIADRLRQELCNNSDEFNNQPSIAGKPGSANLWWNELENATTKPIFKEITETAKTACLEIRESYKPILDHYGIDADDFFWGSIKNEEAEALYQLVLDRKPKIAYQIGTFVGYSALVIAHALRANGSGKLIAVDPEIPHRTFINPVNIAKEAAQKHGLSNFIQFERGWHSTPLGDYIGLKLKRSIPVVGSDIMQNLSGQGIDFAFIDGDHSSACTLTDFLSLKDYLNIDGVAVFHDVLSWPTVAQAICLIWHDIHYFVKGTSAYFNLDIRRGQDGLAILERIAFENFPTLKIKLEDEEGTPIKDACVNFSRINHTVISDVEGAVFSLEEIPENEPITVSHNEYKTLNTKLNSGTQGDYLEVVLTLNKQN